MKTKLRAVLLAVMLAFAPALAFAAPLQTGAAPTRTHFLPIAAEIGQELQQLVTGDPNAEIEPQETFGTRALGFILSAARILAQQGAAFVDEFAAVPQLKTWFDQQISNPLAADKWFGIGKALLFVLGGALMIGWLADFLFLSSRRRIYRREYATAPARFAGVATWFLISLVPVVLFIGAALAIADQMDPGKLARFIVMTVIYAMALYRLVGVGARLFLSPRVPVLRLVPLSSEQASYAYKWIKAFGAVMIFGYFFSEIAEVVQAPEAAISGFKSIIALVVVGMTIAIIMQKRSAVSVALRGELSAAQARQSLAGSLRLWLARSWHILAISYLVIGYLATVIGAKDGFILMQKGTIGTLLSLFFVRLAFYMSSKLTYGGKEGQGASGIYRPVLRFVIRAAAWLLGLAGAAASWGADIPAFIASPWGQRLTGSAFSIGTTVLVSVFVYEFIHGFVDRKLNRRDGQGNPIEASARAKTLLPMARYAALVTLGLVAAFVILSEMGVNTGPLLAGAGVLGVAVGFGSQTLVKDFLTGLFIILEENISVGDAVKIGDNAGIVESMTIRTVRLRDIEGNLHILPFSEITRIINSSKGFSQALVDVGVAYDADLKKVMEVMADVGEAMRKEPAFRSLILASVEVLGVEALGDSAITVRCRIKTAPGQHHNVRRGYLLRLKLRFDQEGIEIPFPQRVVYHKQVGSAPVGE